MKPLESKTFGCFTVEIHYDDSPTDPRDWSNENLDPKILEQWKDGNVYGFITKDENGIEIDSCWCFYSFDEAYESAKENFPTRNDQYFFDISEN
jgi:hypothetical protein